MRTHYVVLITLSFFFSLCKAKTIEHDSIAVVINHIEANKKQLVIFDLDNTLIEPTTELGSDQWFGHAVALYEKQGMAHIDAAKAAVALYHHVHNHIHMHLIETITPTLIHSLQEKQIPVLALTARSFIERTFQQLDTVGLNFTLAAPTHAALDLSTQEPAFYQKGIIFSGNNDKGTILCSFLDRIGLQPDKVIYMDDKAHNITSVERALHERGITCVGIRYTRLDTKVQQLDSACAQQQLDALLAKHPFVYIPTAHA